MHHSSNFGRNPQQVKRSSVAITGTTVYTKHFHSWVRKSNVVQHLCLMLSQNAGDSRAKNTGGTPLKCWCKVATRTLRILQWKFVHSTTNVHNKSRPNLPKAAPATQSHAAPCFPFVSFFLSFLWLALSVTFPFCYLLFCDFFLLRFCSVTVSLRYILCLYVTYPFFLFNLSFCDFSFRLHAHSFSYFFFLIVLMIFESPMYRSEADQIKLPLEYSQNSCWHLLKLIDSITTRLSASCFLIPHFQFSTSAGKSCPRTPPKPHLWPSRVAKIDMMTSQTGKTNQSQRGYVAYLSPKFVPKTRMLRIENVLFWGGSDTGAVPFMEHPCSKTKNEIIFLITVLHYPVVWSCFPVKPKSKS